MVREGESGDVKRRKRNVTPVALVLHLDDEEGEEGDEEEKEEEGEEDEDEDEDEEASGGGRDGGDANADAADAAPRESVSIDVEGRVAGVSDCGLDFSFQSFPNIISPTTAGATTLHCDGLVADCEAAFVGESFWLPATSEPRCALEGIDRYCSPRRQTHLEPSCIEWNGIQ
jgi:hypothetical protein